MTIQDLQEETQTFLDYYVLGSTAARAQVAFPGSSFEGIQFRAPAALGIRPEYAPIPDGNDGTLVPSGADGPEGVGPYLFLDRCPLRATKVTLGADGTVLVDFIHVLQYPPGRFPDATIRQGVEVRLPSHAFHAIAAECLSQLEDAIALDPEVGFPVSYQVTVLDLKTFDLQAG